MIENKIKIDILKLSEKSITKQYPDIIKEINRFIIDNNIYESISFREKLYLYDNNICDTVLCKYCGVNRTRFKSYNKGYVMFCGNLCSFKYRKTLPETEKKKTNQKRAETVNRIYGVDNVAKSPIVKANTRNTNIAIFGTVSPTQNKSVQLKRKNTFDKNWGESKHPLSVKYKIKERSDKRKITMSNRWINTMRDYIKNHSIEEISIDETNRTFKLKCDKDHISNYCLDDLKNRTNTVLCFDCNPKYSANMIMRYNNMNLKDTEILEYRDKKIIARHISKEHCFETSPSILTDRFRYNKDSIFCTICNPIGSNISSYEDVLNQLLIDNNIEFIQKDRKILKGKELDIYIPDKTIGLEFNGIYWHSNLFKSNTYHLDKTIGCYENGIDLIHIFEDDWLDPIRNDILKSILFYKIDTNIRKTYARKSIIKNIDYDLLQDFLLYNDISGPLLTDKEIIAIGLYKNDILLSVMVFESVSISQSYKMIRFSNKKYNSIIGGFSKLFKYFVSTYSFETIETYNDISIFSGKIFRNQGFEYINRTEPVSYNIINNKRSNDDSSIFITNCGYDKYIFKKEKTLKN